MDDKTRIEVMWEERNENKKLLSDINNKLNNIELLLATARGGFRVTAFIAGAVGSFLTFIGTKFFRGDH